jgi:hypothetical protein
MVESVASKRVLDAHPTTTACVGVGVGVRVTTGVAVITTLLLCFGDLYDPNKNGKV